VKYANANHAMSENTYIKSIPDKRTTESGLDLKINYEMRCSIAFVTKKQKLNPQKTPLQKTRRIYKSIEQDVRLNVGYGFPHIISESYFSVSLRLLHATLSPLKVESH